MRFALPPVVFLVAACSPGLGPVVPGTEVERKMISLLEKFDRWDDDGDGALDPTELAAGLRGTGHRPDRVLAFYDTDRNGRVSIREAQAGYHRADEAERLIQQRLQGR